MKNKSLKLLKSNRISGAAFISQKLLNDSFSRNRKGLLVNTFTRMLSAMALGVTKYRVSIICKLIYRFSVLYKHGGMKYLVVYLKATSTLMQQCIGGFRLKDTTGLNARVSRGAGGLPRLIPSQDRVLILKGDTRLMRFYLTIFNLYRILEYPGKLKLNTITDVSKENVSLSWVKDEVVHSVPAFGRLVFKLAGDKLLTHGISMLPILKSSPGASPWASSTHPITLLMNARLHKETGTDSLIMYFAKFFEKGTKVRYPGFISIFQRCADLAITRALLPSTTYSLGKLGFKNEPAGKVRVFAMVDAWTNWVLRPLHDEIFRILKYFPTDGTFDQLKPVKLYTDWPSAYSLDLTAATDRLPISLQIRLLTTLWGKEFAVNWARLLVDRVYSAVLPLNRKEQKIEQVVNLKYAVGQPMGALSSWAMLALTHHLIVHAAAWSSGVIPHGQLYTRYAVLGDDLVIGDMAVKDRYLLILDALGVECGLHKSVLSTKAVGVEFAKRTLYKGLDVSPVPLLEFITATYNLPSAVAYAHKYALTISELVKSMGYGYKVLGGLNKPIGMLNSRVRMLMMAIDSPLITADAQTIETWLARGNSSLGAILPEAVTPFMETVIDRVTGLIKRSYAFNTATYIAAYVKNFRMYAWSRYGYTYLLSIVPQDYLGPGIVKYDPSRAMDMWDHLPREGTFKVPGATLNRIEDDLRSLDLLITQLLSNMVGPQVETSRSALGRLRSDMTRLGRQTPLWKAYVYSLEALKACNSVTIITDFKRAEDEFRFKMDVEQIKL